MIQRANAREESFGEKVRQWEMCESESEVEILIIYR